MVHADEPVEPSSSEPLLASLTVALIAKRFCFSVVGAGTWKIDEQSFAPSLQIFEESK